MTAGQKLKFIFPSGSEINYTNANILYGYHMEKKYWVTPFNLSVSVFSATLPQVCKIKQIALQCVFTHICERMGHFKECIR